MILTGISAVAVYDPSDGTTAQISKVVGNTFEFHQTGFDSGERTASGGKRRTADVSECRFQFIDSDGTLVKALEAWEGATRVSLVAAGAGVCLQWYETDLFELTRLPLKGTVSRGDLYELSIRREGHGRHDIWQQTNLMAHINGRGVTSWQEDPDTADIADGYTPTGGSSNAWDDGNNAQQITDNTADEGIYVDIVFPIQVNGFTFTLTSDILDLHTDTASATVRIEGKNFAGTNVTTAENDATATGRQSTSISSASGTALYTIRAYPILTPTGVTTSDTVSAKEPVLTVDASTAFIEN